MKEFDNGVVNACAVPCLLVRGMKCSTCDFVSLRSKLSPRLQAKCACAGEKGNQCVLRFIQTRKKDTETEKCPNIVQLVLRYESRKSRGEENPEREIIRSIRRYEIRDRVLSCVAWGSRLVRSLYNKTSSISWVTRKRYAG